jgi:hypothetical protein
MPAYRSAQGKMVDMSQLTAKNEKVRAVGNMNVNARGDILDSHNRVIKDNTKRVKSSYQKSVGTKTPTAKPVAPSKPQIKEDIVEELTQSEKELFENDDEDIIK